jgi:hypothetical protein
MPSPLIPLDALPKCEGFSIPCRPRKPGVIGIDWFAPLQLERLSAKGAAMAMLGDLNSLATFWHWRQVRQGRQQPAATGATR